MTRRTRFSGQSMTEYALPAICILVVGGVLATTLDMNRLLDEYFMGASGHGDASRTGSTFKPGGLGDDASGATGNGAAGFDSLGKLTDAGGGTVRIGGGSYTYDGPSSRNGRPLVAGSNGDNLYDVQGKGPMYELAAKLAKAGAPAEYVGRVLQSAATTELLAKSKGGGGSSNMDAYTAALRSQLSSNQAYAMAHMNEVLAHGGLEGVQIWKAAMGDSIRNSDDITNAVNGMNDAMSAGMIQRLNSLMANGASNDMLNAGKEKCSVSGSTCAATGTEADGETAAFLALMAGGSSPGEQMLMNQDSTSDYVWHNYDQFTAPKAEAAYKSGMPATP